VTWPSAAIATFPSRRTSITVVDRILFADSPFAINQNHSFLTFNAQIDRVPELSEHLVLWLIAH